MKKTLLISLSLMLALTLAACGISPATQSPAPEASPAATSTVSGEASPDASPDAPATPNPAEVSSGASTATSPIALSLGAELSLDLDGDGTDERISFNNEALNEWDSVVVLTLNSSISAASYRYRITNGFSGFASDIDLDGTVELIFSGDEMSDDYSTYMVRYADGGFINAASPFDASFYEADGYVAPAATGAVEAVGRGFVTISRFVNVLGTWGAESNYALDPDKFALVPTDGVFTSTEDPEDADFWTYGAPVTSLEFPVTLDGANEKTLLAAGTKLKFTATDLETYVDFITESGQTGRIALTAKTGDVFGWMIGELDELDCFDMLYYAG